MQTGSASEYDKAVLEIWSGVLLPCIHLAGIRIFSCGSSSTLTSESEVSGWVGKDTFRKYFPSVHASLRDPTSIYAFELAKITEAIQLKETSPYAA